MADPVLLSIDFDYFIREDNAWDWTHGEAPFYQGPMWTIRESQAINAGIDLRKETDPNKYATPKPLLFFDTLAHMGFDFSKTPVFVADSHALAYPTFCDAPRKKNTRILNFDAHHDLGYDLGQVKKHIAEGICDCADWLMVTLASCKTLTAQVIYPTWKGLCEWEFTHLARVAEPMVWSKPKVSKLAGPISRIFICRSGSWVPPWYDKLFIDFVKSACALTKTIPLNVYQTHEKMDPLTPREYSRKQVKVMAAQFDKFCKAASNG